MPGVGRLLFMRELLAEYQDFQECVLLDVRWRQWGFALELVFDYIWKEKDVLRDNLDAEEKVVLRFSAVQEFHVSYKWNDFILSEPEVIDWGSGEISLIRLEENESFLEKYRSRPVPFHHVAVLWEGSDKRRIDIVFSQLEIWRE
jgi:hypothetical protein